MWCLVRHINAVKMHPERITREDKKLINDDRVGFPVREKYFSKIETKTTFALMCFVMKTSSFFQSTFQIKDLKTRWICYSYLMVIYRIMCTSKVLIDLCFTKQNIKAKNTFTKVVYSVLVVKMR